MHLEPLCFQGWVTLTLLFALASVNLAADQTLGCLVHLVVCLTRRTSLVFPYLWCHLAFYFSLFLQNYYVSFHTTSHLFLACSSTPTSSGDFFHSLLLLWRNPVDIPSPLLQTKYWFQSSTARPSDRAKHWSQSHSISWCPHVSGVPWWATPKQLHCRSGIRYSFLV